MRITAHNDLAKFTVIVLAIAGMLALSAVRSSAQDETDITETAPPPLRKLSEQERRSLDALPEVKKRTKLALDLMSARLTHAEAFSANGQYAELYAELGGFHGLMDETLTYLEKSDKDNNKVLNNFKRFEIGLRGFSPRLEVIRRDMPLRYEYYVRVLLRYLREARTRAVEPLFDDTVVKPKKTDAPQ